jgi:hypothetical protein
MSHYSDLENEKKIGKIFILSVVGIVTLILIYLYGFKYRVDFSEFSKSFCLYDQEKMMNHSERQEIEKTCHELLLQKKIRISFLILERKSGTKTLSSKIPSIAENEVRFTYRDFLDDDQMKVEIGKRVVLNQETHQQAVKSAVMDLRLKTGATAIEYLFLDVWDNAKLK